MNSTLPIKLDSGHLLIPATAEDEGIIGDGVIEIDSTHPDYQSWLTFMESQSKKEE